MKGMLSRVGLNELLDGASSEPFNYRLFLRGARGPEHIMRLGRHQAPAPQRRSQTLRVAPR